MKKVLVCGGRKYVDTTTVYRVLDKVREEAGAPVFIIHGDAPGADNLAGRWAKYRGMPCAAVAAHWDFYRKSAGPRRNGWMLELQPDLVVAFPGNDGTKNMIHQAERAGVPVQIVA